MLAAGGLLALCSPAAAAEPKVVVTIKPLHALVAQVMNAEPYASARRVFWVVDNGASHRNWAAAARLSDAYPNAQMVHLPVHASWLNQVPVNRPSVRRHARAV